MSDLMNNLRHTNGADVKDVKRQGEAAIAKFGDSFEEITHDVASKAAELSEKSISTIKKYPLHTALAAGAAGFIIGAIVARK